MRILVTGGAGFIGSHVADGYLAAGHDVAILDNLSTGFTANIPPTAQFYNEDIRSVEAIKRVFQSFRPDIVNHHAAQVEPPKSVADPVNDATINVLGTVNILSSCVDHAVRKIIFSSTGGALYGNPDRVPCTEDEPVQPLSPYWRLEFG